MTFKTKKPAVKRMTFELGENAKFDKENLVEILSNITFKLININLSIKKEYAKLNGTGYTSIGYVNGFDKENCTFDTVIFNNREEIVKNLGECIITVRAFTDKDNKITKIISLDVEPKQS